MSCLRKWKYRRHCALNLFKRGVEPLVLLGGKEKSLHISFDSASWLTPWRAPSPHITYYIYYLARVPIYTRVRVLNTWQLVCVCECVSLPPLVPSLLCMALNACRFIRHSSHINFKVIHSYITYMHACKSEEVENWEISNKSNLLKLCTLVRTCLLYTSPSPRD